MKAIKRLRKAAERGLARNGLKGIPPETNDLEAKLLLLLEKWPETPIESENNTNPKAHVTPKDEIPRARPCSTERTILFDAMRLSADSLLANMMKADKILEDAGKGGTITFRVDKKEKTNV